MNEHSSRSHAIFIVTVECCAVSLLLDIALVFSSPSLHLSLSLSLSLSKLDITNFQAGPDGSEHIRMGKLNLVDLAGSERQSKTGSTVSIE